MCTAFLFGAKPVIAEPVFRFAKVGAHFAKSKMCVRVAAQLCTSRSRRAQKSDKFRLTGFFIQAAGLAYHHALACIKNRNDDIQGYALIYLR